MSSRNDKLDLEREVERLTRKVDRLRLEQEIAERQLLLVQDSLTNGRTQRGTVEATDRRHHCRSTRSFRPEKVESTNIKIAKIKKELEYTRNNVPEIGDVIRIINPRPGQEARGTIEDFCRDGKAKIRTPLGKIITRDIKNIRYQVYAQYVTRH